MAITVVMKPYLRSELRPLLADYCRWSEAVLKQLRVPITQWCAVLECLEQARNESAPAETGAILGAKGGLNEESCGSALACTAAGS